MAKIVKPKKVNPIFLAAGTILAVIQKLSNRFMSRINNLFVFFYYTSKFLQLKDCYKVGVAYRKVSI